jgi:hypothetical protein
VASAHQAEVVANADAFLARVNAHLGHAERLLVKA